jgi:hemolysin activation/secretion protein
MVDDRPCGAAALPTPGATGPIVRAGAGTQQARTRQVRRLAGGIGLRGRSLALAATACIALVSGGALLAQTAADITPASLAPELQRLVGTVQFTGAPGLGVPEGADRLSVTIRGVDTEGAFPAMAAAQQRLEQRLVGRVIPVSEIFLAAQELEAAYAEAGFVLARVVLPEQQLRDGDRLRLTVVDGFVERVDAAAVPEPVRARISGLTAPLEGRPGLRLQEIERALLIAGDTFGVALESALAAGDAPGATQLVLGGEFRPVTGFVGIDTSHGSKLGGYSLDTGVELNSLLGLSETIYFRASGNPSGSDTSGGLFSATPRMRTLATGIVVPLGSDGLTGNLELTESRTTPRAATGVLPTTTRFRRGSVRMSWPLVRSRELNIVLRGGLDLLDDRQAALLAGGQQVLSQDRLRVLRVGANMVQFDPEGGLNEAGATLSLGLNALGARSGTAAVPMSRDGARPNFAKVELSGRMVRPLGERLVFAGSARAQSAFGRPLPQSEQIGFASLSEMSGFASGSVTGDSGAMVRGELRAPTDVATSGMPVRATPYAFAATGMLWLHRPTAAEVGRQRVSSFGVGVEVLPMLESQFSSAALRVEAARGLRHGTLGAGVPRNENQLSLVGTVRF